VVKLPLGGKNSDRGAVPRASRDQGGKRKSKSHQKEKAETRHGHQGGSRWEKRRKENQERESLLLKARENPTADGEKGAFDTEGGGGSFWQGAGKKNSDK